MSSRTLQLWQGNLEAQFDLILPDHAERLRGAFATPNVFDLLGVSASRGRLFGSADDIPNQPGIVIGYALWQRAFGGDSTLIGRPLTLTVGREFRAPKSFTVLGVLPPEFRFTYPQETEVWAALPWTDIPCTRGIAYHAIARLREGIGLDAARAQLSTMRAGLDQAGVSPENRQVIRVEPIIDWVAGDFKPTFQLLECVSALLLVIAGQDGRERTACSRD